MTAALLRSAGSVLLVSLPGFAALRGASHTLSPRRSGRWALAFALGVAITVPAALAAGLLGLALRGRAIVAICVLLSLAIRLLAKAPRERSRDVLPPLSRVTIASRFLLAAATALFLVKIALVPVWSWDYYAVHGTKARRVFAEKTLDVRQLNPSSLALSHPDYPLGMPVAWRLIALGAPPDGPLVKLAHVVFALALLALVREGVLAASCPESVANTAAAFTAISPLFWDTESLGLVEAPFALFLAAAFLVFLRLEQDFPVKGGWIWGALAGFLPWIKFREGLTLGALLCIAILLSGKAKRNRGALAAALVWAAASTGVSVFLLPPGERFLAGDWMARGLSRLAHPGAVFLPLANDLLAPEWFGFWIVLAAVWIYSVVRRRRTAALLASVIAAQIAAYASVYFFTYLDPAAHIRSSFFRIVAALLPAASIAIAASSSELRSSRDH